MSCYQVICSKYKTQVLAVLSFQPQRAEFLRAPQRKGCEGCRWSPLSSPPRLLQGAEGASEHGGGFPGSLHDPPQTQLGLIGSKAI